jgi:phosphoglycerate dehydrogenase-like enzyme
MKVLVPHEPGVAVLGRVPGVNAVRYDPGAPLPMVARDAQVLVPPLLGFTDGHTLLHDLPRLQLVQLLSAGAEAWVGQVPEGIALSDCRGAHGGATAEWVLTALLAVLRHVPRLVRAQAEQRWDHHVTDELAGKRVLIVGAGDVASETAKRLHAFDAVTTLVARTSRFGVHGMDELHDLLPHHDVVVLAMPLTRVTRHLCDHSFLARMRDGAVLVNAARGPVVDTEALVAELTSGRLRAAVDVTHPEPLPHGHPLWSAPGLLVTPHVGGSVPQHLSRAYRVAAEQIACWARGQRPPNLVVDGY